MGKLDAAAQIDALTTEAEKCIQKAMEIADEYEISFDYKPEHIGTYTPQHTEWYSSDSCEWESSEEIHHDGYWSHRYFDWEASTC
jgi:hypothetical protein